MNENMYIYIMYKKILLIHPLRKASLLNIYSAKSTLAVFKHSLFYCYLMILFLSDDAIVVYNATLFMYLFSFIYFTYFYFQFI